MKIEQLSKDKTTGKIILHIKGINGATVNSLRRLIMDSVPVMAIEDVELVQNTSAIYDEMLALRLGLIALTTELKDYNSLQDCKCKGEGCARCSVNLKLSVKGPCTVYASDIKSKDSKIKPVEPDTVIVKLLKNQEIEANLTAVLGKGSDHVKWSPGLCWFINYPKLTINNNSEKFEDFKEKYPPQIFKNGKIEKDIIIEKNMIDAVEGVCDDVVKVEYLEDEFLFFIESWGQLSPREMFTTALEIFKEKIKELDEKL